MKVGVITFFYAPNYGAMLQAYALWHYLEQHGHTVEFIDFALPNTRRSSLFSCFITRHFIKYFSILRVKLKSYVRFGITRFADTFPKTDRITTFEGLRKIAEKYDVVVAGSDQIWNPIWCNGMFLPVVMLDFVANGVKRVAYAVSFGTKEWKEEQNLIEASRLIRKFDALSVRELSGVQLAKDMSVRNDVEWLPDPTLLQNAQFYAQLFDGPREDASYVFSYVLDEWADEGEFKKILSRVTERIGRNRILTDRMPVGGRLSFLCRMLGVQSKIPVGVWLSRIAHASFVVTNSFHGTVFSILFKKPFVTILIDSAMSGMNERIVSLLGRLGLEERCIHVGEVDQIPSIVDQNINWEVVSEELSEWAGEADAYFDRVLGQWA